MLSIVTTATTEQRLYEFFIDINSIENLKHLMHISEIELVKLLSRRIKKRSHQVLKQNYTDYKIDYTSENVWLRSNIELLHLI